ncbi:MAG: hypothetical protein ACLFNK_00610 [Candidatus Woesearchaeota archaeon]
MGFSGIASQIIMFIALITIATGLVVVFNTNIREASTSLRIQSNAMALSMRTDVTIDMVSHDQEMNTTHVYVRNTGRTQLNHNDTDVYLDGLRVPRNDTNRTIQLLEDTDQVNEGVWDPSEQILIEIFMPLDETETHEVSIITDHDGRDEKKFTVD